jgi:hypothetical protein
MKKSGATTGICVFQRYTASLGSIVLAHAAIDAAVAEWPQERFKLQNGIMLMREHLKRPDK